MNREMRRRIGYLAEVIDLVSVVDKVVVVALAAVADLVADLVAGLVADLVVGV